MSFLSKTIYEVEPSALGLDITDSYLRAVLLRATSGGKVRVEAYGQQELKPGLIEDGLIKNDQALLPFFEELKRSAKIGFLGAKFVVAAIPESTAFLQVFSVPKMKREELAQAIRWEIEGNIPLNVNEVYFDWQEIPFSQQSFDHTDVLVAAASRNVLEEYLRLLESARLVPKALEVESLAISRALIQNQFAAKPLLIIDLGASRSTFIIYAGQAVRFTSALPISGRQLTQVVAQALSVSFEEAEQLKQEYGLAKNAKTSKGAEALLEVLDELVAQVQRYLIYYKSHTFHEHGGVHVISKILLSGGGANLKGLTQHLGSRLKFDVEVANPWVNILETPFKELPTLSFEKSLSFTTAIGLALRGLPKEG